MSRLKRKEHRQTTGGVLRQDEASTERKDKYSLTSSSRLLWPGREDEARTTRLSCIAFGRVGFTM